MWLANDWPLIVGCWTFVCIKTWLVAVSHRDSNMPRDLSFPSFIIKGTIFEWGKHRVWLRQRRFLCSPSTKIRLLHLAIFLEIGRRLRRHRDGFVLQGASFGCVSFPPSRPPSSDAIGHQTTNRTSGYAPEIRFTPQNSSAEKRLTIKRNIN